MNDNALFEHNCLLMSTLLDDLGLEYRTVESSRTCAHFANDIFGRSGLHLFVAISARQIEISIYGGNDNPQLSRRFEQSRKRVRIAHIYRDSTTMGLRASLRSRSPELIEEWLLSATDEMLRLAAG